MLLFVFDSPSQLSIVGSLSKKLSLNLDDHDRFSP